MNRRFPISGVDSPSAISRRTSDSRVVRIDASLRSWARNSSGTPVWTSGASTVVPRLTATIASQIPARVAALVRNPATARVAALVRNPATPSLTAS
jgi:hypothetical protein